LIFIFLTNFELSLDFSALNQLNLVNRFVTCGSVNPGSDCGSSRDNCLWNDVFM
jgi:hypothetical protein